MILIIVPNYRKTINSINTFITNLIIICKIIIVTESNILTPLK